MAGLILVVDDNEKNLRLLEALLSNEYYDVVTAIDGFECLEKVKQRLPDVILLDVMMPGMDGFETCRRLKSLHETSHIPVVMVTALGDKSDRVKGLEAGADDFITKPVKELQLISRVKSLIRIKVLLDELRMRDRTGAEMGLQAPGSEGILSLAGSRVMIVDDDIVQSAQIADALKSEYTTTVLEDAVNTTSTIVEGNCDLAIISTQLMDADGLRICSQLRSREETRNLPIIALIESDDERTLIKGLELGINDYVMTPVDNNEMLARVKTQLKRKRYQDALKANYKKSVSMAITDSLTGLYNRHYLDNHLESMIAEAKDANGMFSVMMLDMDHFKSVNDSYGHDSGDEVLKELAGRITRNVRSSDTAARIGGEEFVVLMPRTDIETASMVAERIRREVERSPFSISHPAGRIKKTISIGVAATLTAPDETVQLLLKRADEALYTAKNTGRNQVVVAGSTPPATPLASATVW